MAHLSNGDGLWKFPISTLSYGDQQTAAILHRFRKSFASAQAAAGVMAMWVLVKNRGSHSGILDGSGLTDAEITKRWCPHVTVPALKRVYAVRHRITLVEGDGVQVLRDYSDARACASLVDPPYSIQKNERTCTRRAPWILRTYFMS
jgi:hypothetical protein